MELFTVNRYTEESAVAKPKTDQDEILQKLLKKVEKRKQQKKTKVEQNEEDKQEQPPPKQKKVKVTAASETVLEPISAIEEKQDVDPIAGYEILGEDVAVKQRQPQVNMVLPHWLAHPTVISTSIAAVEGAEDDAIASTHFLAPHIRNALKQMHVTRLFPVQSAVIPWILEAQSKPTPFRPRDICVSAPTGSGKTLAFAIPVVQLLANRVERRIRALVVLPVAELALQVFKVFKILCDKTDLSVCLLSKQMPFPLEQEKLVEEYKGAYYSMVDIVVTTPGRLVDHLHSTKGFCLKSLKFLVIDEADRIMDAVFQNWLYHLDEHVRNTSDKLLSGRAAPLCLNELQLSCDTQPHKLLFSATLSQDPEKLQNLRLFQPKLFTSVLTNLSEMREKIANSTAEQQEKTMRGEFIGKYTTPAELTEKYCITESRLKPLTLYSLIIENGWTKFLCFTNSAESSGRLGFVLAKLLKDKLVIKELSASISAKQRANVLSQFSRGKVNGLICSDALARGIDIPDVDIVISYDPARHVKTYIHRVGRTARAGRQGTAITLLTQKELITFNQTLAEVGKVITEEIKVISSATEENMAKSYAVTLQELRQKLEQDKRTKIVLKERTKERAQLHTKDTSNMTIMEKLQAQASKKVLDKALLEQTELLSAKKQPSKTFKPKKFNASAGKRNIKNIKQ